MRQNDNEFSSPELAAIRQIRNALVHFGRTPSIRELMSLLNYKSPKSIQDILEQLFNKGILQKTGSRGYSLITNPDLGASHAQTTNIPIVGVAACGAPILAEQNIEGYVPISTTIAKNGHKYFLLHAKGDSMNQAGIDDGDLVLIRQQSTANEGDRVVALIDDEATIKEFHKTNDLVILRPRSSNQTHKAIILEEEFQIQGIVIKVISDL